MCAWVVGTDETAQTRMPTANKVRAAVPSSRARVKRDSTSVCEAPELVAPNLHMLHCQRCPLSLTEQTHEGALPLLVTLTVKIMTTPSVPTPWLISLVETLA